MKSRRKFKFCSRKDNYFLLEGYKVEAQQTQTQLASYTTSNSQ